MKRALIAISLLLLMAEANSSPWWRRRRRRSPPSCSAVNCQVETWTSWGSCSHQCGTSGTQTRTRQQTQAASCGGTCPYSLSETRACNRDNCQNGGTPHSSGCSCRAGYHGTCCEQDVNECLNNPCQHTCTNTAGSFTCSCHSCYTKVGYNCDLRQCKISNQCYSYGAVNPSNQCQDCNSANKQAWTNNNALPCTDNIACTKSDRCSNGVCSGTPFTCLSCEECYNDACRVKPGFCVINDGGSRKCFNHGNLRPGYPCQDCNIANKRAWTNKNSMPCNDNVTCTRNDRCSNGVCTGTPFTCLPCEECYNDECRVKPGFCLINDSGRRQCFDHGAVRPGYPCQDCNSANKLAWTNNNVMPCNDSVTCTRNDRCSNGVCTGTPFTCLPCEECYNDTCRVKPGFCLINDSGRRQCFNHGAVRPGYPCQDCNSTNNLAWTNNNTLSCSDNKLCTKNDQCSNGVCSGMPFTCLSCEECYNDTCQLKPGFCTINDGGTRKCVNGGALRPGYPCQWCYPCNSSSTWSNLDGIACDDGNKCTRGDVCKSGQCVAKPFTCDFVCHYCNGNGCSLKAGYGFVNNNCTCKIAGQDYSYQALNPSNQCQWCDLYDAPARGNITWTNRPSVACDDQDKCTKQDMCDAGRCVGKGYSCQKGYSSSSCIRTSECVGDGTCRPIMRSSGTICRPAVDICDQPERCDGSLGTCPGAVEDKITVTVGTAQLMDHTFNSVVSYQYFTDKLYLKISGFCVSCGQLTLNWFLLSSTSPCSTTSTVSGTFSNNNMKQTLTGLALQVNERYKVSIQASDMRNNTPKVVCTDVVIIKTSNHSTG